MLLSSPGKNRIEQNYARMYEDHSGPSSRLQVRKIFCRPNCHTQNNPRTVTRVQAIPLYNIHRLWEGIWQPRQGSSLAADEILQHPKHLQCDAVQSYTWRPANWAIQHHNRSETRVCPVTFSLLLVVDWFMRQSTKCKHNEIQWTLTNLLVDLDFAEHIAYSPFFQLCPLRILA